MTDMQTTPARPEEPTVGEAEKPFGPVAAVFLAAGIGALVLGILTVLAEASESFAETLTLSEPVGPLSGKSTFAAAAFVVAWIVLALVMRRINPSRGAIYWITGLLVIAGLVLTFPPVFLLFAPAE